MKNMTVFHPFLFVLVFAAEKSMAATVRSTTVSYDEFRLVLQWPPSYCNAVNITCNHPIPHEFKVHGLWVCKNSRSLNFNGLPSTCTQLQISQDILNYLSLHWPNLNSRTPRDFLWRHEYKKHGRGIPEFFNPENYFQTARTFATNIGDVLQMRLATGRNLTRGQSYDVNEFNPVTILGRKLIPMLQCNYGNGIIPQLLQITFCADSRNNLKDCNYRVGRCPQRFNFPWVQ